MAHILWHTLMQKRHYRRVVIAANIQYCIWGVSDAIRVQGEWDTTQQPVLVCKRNTPSMAGVHLNHSRSCHKEGLAVSKDSRGSEEGH